MRPFVKVLATVAEKLRDRGRAGKKPGFGTAGMVTGTCGMISGDVTLRTGTGGKRDGESRMVLISSGIGGSARVGVVARRCSGVIRSRVDGKPKPILGVGVLGSPTRNVIGTGPFEALRSASILPTSVIPLGRFPSDV